MARDVVVAVGGFLDYNISPSEYTTILLYRRASRDTNKAPRETYANQLIVFKICVIIMLWLIAVQSIINCND